MHVGSTHGTEHQLEEETERFRDATAHFFLGRRGARCIDGTVSSRAIFKAIRGEGIFLPRGETRSEFRFIDENVSRTNRT